MDLSASFRRCLEDLDIKTARTIWKETNPHLSQPASDEQMLVCLHMARTQADSMRSNFRFYSHRWLLDHGYPSQLPDHLKPCAERLYPKVVEAVGISVNANSELLKPIIPIVRRAMEDSVQDSFADGLKDPLIIKKRMQEAKAKAVRKLLGS